MFGQSMKHQPPLLPRQTERLVLYPPSIKFAEIMQGAIEETFDDLHLWLPWAREMQALEETQAFLKAAESQFHQGSDFTVLVFLRHTDEFVLVTGLHPRNWSVPKFEIGYWCSKSMQGKGFVTEAVQELTAIAFHDMAAQRVEIRADARNIASRRVAERAGYHLEARLQAEDRANDGSLRDTVIYTMLAETSSLGKRGESLRTDIKYLSLP